MCSAVTSNSSLVIPTDTLSLLRCRGNSSFFTSPRSVPFSLRPKTPRFLRLSACLAESNHLEFSWLPPESNPLDNSYGGWVIVDTPRQSLKKKRGLNAILIGAAGSSIAVLLTTIAYFSISRKGFKFQYSSPLHAIHGMLSWNETGTNVGKTRDSIVSDENTMVSEGNPEPILDTNNETVTSASTEICERVIISVPVDSTQQEALSVLKKLKIIEDDAKADELCTRREYARWLVRVNLLLERNPKHRIVPAISLSGSVTAAFDDVGVGDPDFGAIQALAEAGIISSKLSGNNSSSNGLEDIGSINFSPERYISRRDLINWKAQVEYQFEPAITEEISRTKVEYMDMKEFYPDVSPELLTDMLAGDKSIVRKVFGQSKRFQPNKPSTKAQAAVALTSGRMTEAISTELVRLEMESYSRQPEMEEIRCQLLDKGDIQRFWDEKLNEERTRSFEIKNLCLAAIRDLEQEKIVQEKCFAHCLKEKAAMECQKQLLFSLKKEVDEMSERLASERAVFVSEQSKLQDMLRDLQFKQEGLLDTKSILEAEIEALRILRSWVEDEARKSQARAKVLEEVGRRWKWDDQA